jgi:hypothetical protein
MVGGGRGAYSVGPFGMEIASLFVNLLKPTGYVTHQQV